MKHNLEAVISDLDNSLLDDQKRIHPDDLAAIKIMKGKGIPFFVSTGRHFSFAKQIVSGIGFDYPVCACNGTHIYDYAAGKTLFAARRIPREIVAGLIDYLRERNISFIVYNTEIPVFDTPDSRRAQHWQKQRLTFAPGNRFDLHYIGDPDIDLLDSHVLKFLVAYIDEEVKADIERRFNAGHELSILWSEKNLLDINTAGTSKGTGALELARLFGFDPANTLALGDNFNDAPLLATCGVPVAPENAEDDVKAIAKYITADNNNAPLSHALRALYPGLLD